MDDSQTAIRAPVRLPSADGDRRCILVLGMHRSGTSVVTRIISLLGADLPLSLMGPREDNPRGFWESRELQELHDQLLSSGGSRWDDWEPFPRPNQTIDQKDTIQGQLGSVLQREYGASKLFVVKDPRMCRFVPIWLDVLQRFRAEPIAVLPLRHPFEVAHSLHHRNGIPFTAGCLLWLRHVIEAERTTRQIPRVFVNYEFLLADWSREVGRLARGLGIPCPRASDEAAAAIIEFLSAKLRHHTSSLHELDTRSDVVDWVRRTYHTLRSLSADGENEAAYGELDQVRREFDNACLAFRGLFRAEWREVPRRPKKPIARPRQSRAELHSRPPSVPSLPARAMHAIFACGRRVERSFRKWRRRESSGNPIH